MELKNWIISITLYIVYTVLLLLYFRFRNKKEDDTIFQSFVLSGWVCMTGGLMMLMIFK